MDYCERKISLALCCTILYVKQKQHNMPVGVLIEN